MSNITDIIDVKLPELPEQYFWKAFIADGRFELSLNEITIGEPSAIYDSVELDSTTWALRANTAELLKKVLVEADLMKQSVLDSVLLRDAINKKSKTNKSGVEINGK